MKREFEAGVVSATTPRRLEAGLLNDVLCINQQNELVKPSSFQYCGSYVLKDQSARV